MRAYQRSQRKSGQTIIFVICVLVILTFILFWNFDLHKILHVKFRSQNAGDSAALAAARWQGISLNIIGDLNIMQAAALTGNDTDSAQAIAGLQARLCYAGPMTAFAAAQQAAKNNGMYNNDDFTEYLEEHWARVTYDYPSMTDGSGKMLFPEPYPGAWEDYSDMLSLFVDDGIAAAPDNATLYGDAIGGHMLYNMAFYNAIAGGSWCWFWHNAMDTLEEYTDYRWWDALPVPPHVQYMNAEIFGLRLTAISVVDSLDLIDNMNELSTERSLTAAEITTNIFNFAANWYCYNSSGWAPWETLYNFDGYEFPWLDGFEVKPQYEYIGADAAIRLELSAERLSPGSADSQITWTSAAKPFGYLNDTERPNEYDVVLPAFHDVRLIPLDACTMPAGGAYNLRWREHVEDHLPEYMDRGLSGITLSCWYCAQLITWENDAWRRVGISWLEVNSALCNIPSGAGGHSSGGTRRGH